MTERTRLLRSTLLASPQRSRSKPTEPEVLRLLPSCGADLASPAPRYRPTVPIPSNTLSHRPIASHIVREAAASNGRKGVGSETVGLATSLSRHGEASPCLCRRRIGEWTDASISKQTGTCTSDLSRIARCLRRSRRFDASSSYPHASRQHEGTPRIPPSRSQGPKGILGSSSKRLCIETMATGLGCGIQSSPAPCPGKVRRADCAICSGLPSPPKARPSGSP